MPLQFNAPLALPYECQDAEMGPGGVALSGISVNVNTYVAIQPGVINLAGAKRLSFYGAFSVAAGLQAELSASINGFSALYSASSNILNKSPQLMPPTIVTGNVNPGQIFLTVGRDINQGYYAVWDGTGAQVTEGTFIFGWGSLAALGLKIANGANGTGVFTFGACRLALS